MDSINPLIIGIVGNNQNENKFHWCKDPPTPKLVDLENSKYLQHVDGS